MGAVQKVFDFIRSPLKRKEVPTEYVRDDDISAPPPQDLSSREKWIKLFVASRVEDADLVMPLMDAFSVVFVDVRHFKNMDDLKRFVDHIKVASPRYKAALIGLDPSWLILLSKDVGVEE